MPQAMPFRASSRREASPAYRLPPCPDKDKDLRARLKELAELYPHCGYLMLHNPLKGEGPVINKRRTHRLYKEMMLQLSRRMRNRLDRPKLAMDIPDAPDLRRSMDFLFDRLSRGRRLKILNIMDDHSREAVGQPVGFSITGAQVARSAQAHPRPARCHCLRQRSRVHRQGDVLLEREAGRQAELYPARQTDPSTPSRRFWTASSAMSA